jgi:hypothetical protein
MQHGPIDYQTALTMLSERGFRLITPTNDTALLRSGAETAASKPRRSLE